MYDKFCTIVLIKQRGGRSSDSLLVNMFSMCTFFIAHIMDIKYHLNLVKQYDALSHLSWNTKCVIKVFLFLENKNLDFAILRRFNRYGEKNIFYLCHKLNFTTNDNRAVCILVQISFSFLCRYFLHLLL